MIVLNSNNVLICESSPSLIFAAISREDSEESHHHRSGHTNGSGVVGGNKGQYNGFTSDEYLDRLEPSNGNVEKSDKRYAKRKFPEWIVQCSSNHQRDRGPKRTTQFDSG